MWRFRCASTSSPRSDTVSARPGACSPAARLRSVSAWSGSSKEKAWTEWPRRGRRVCSAQPVRASDMQPRVCEAPVMANPENLSQPRKQVSVERGGLGQSGYTAGRKEGDAALDDVLDTRYVAPPGSGSDGLG